jgi:CO dehydrogenase/acetyl-CoA synthase alpha subunit
MAMCGADLIGICTETLLRGYDFISEVVTQTKMWLVDHGFSSLGEVRDSVVSSIKTAPELTIYDGFAVIREPNLTAPCSVVCPSGIPVQAILKNLSIGNTSRAIELAAGSEQCSTCAAPCETACVKERVNQGLSIRALFLWLREYATVNNLTIREGTKNQSVKKPSAKAMDVLSSRIINGAEQKCRSISSIDSAVCEASRCLGCGCGEGCTRCIDVCIEFAIGLSGDQVSIDSENCIACGICYNCCPNRNIDMHSTGKVL